MKYLLGICVVAIICLVIAAIFMQRKMKNMQTRIRELIKENDTQKAENKSSEDEMVFKTDKNLMITDINESLCKELGLQRENLIGQSVFGTLLEDSDAVRGNIKHATNKIIKSSHILNNNLLLQDSENKPHLMACHQRPILNEILQCEGISVTCKNIGEEKVLHQKLREMDNLDMMTGALKQEVFLSRLEQDFSRANRYNKDFCLMLVDLRDLCDFINKGISFERGDKLFKNMAELCMEKTDENGYVGRLDKAKLGIILNDFSREDADKLAKDIFSSSKARIRKLGVDDYNAQMMIISYTERKGFNDTYDYMLERTKKHIKNAAKRHQYGVMTSDNERKIADLPTKYEKV